jgi:hypothetical protein
LNAFFDKAFLDAVEVLRGSGTGVLSGEVILSRAFIMIKVLLYLIGQQC